MRVWIIESTPDYEQSTRHGIFGSPHAAWDTLFGLLDGDVFTQHRFTLEVQQLQDPGQADVTLDFVCNSNDRLRLSGEYVKGTGDPALTAREAQEFQEVAALASGHARKIEGFTRGIGLEWDVRRVNELTCIWNFAKEDLPF